MNNLLKAWRTYWNGDDTDEEVRRKLVELDRRMDEIEIDMRIVYDHLSSIDSPKISPRTSSTDSTGGGSNLGAYIKPNMDHTTTLQWVTGKEKKYNTRKRVYDTMNMVKVLDKKSAGPKEHIKKFKQNLQDENVPYEDISESTMVLKCVADKLTDEYFDKIKDN
ncbi:38.7 kDa protein [Hyphantria cunea granulovirus]|uniref:38.7 kDa protein n=1 Tax=Hyphantria cunea granulovirus TaxID=307448 RepID=A0AAF1D282_9BBAC|nr:38.7 kDa protein [Hyphantria cunea granulovirus]QBQ01616.1 38.7 kDa protein [Hyphantria cunea granulovirus]